MNVLHYNGIKIDAEARYVEQEEMLNKLKALSPEELKQAIPTAAPDSILGQLLQDELATDTRLVTLSNDYGPQSPELTRVLVLKTELDKQIGDRLKGIMEGMETRVASLKAIVENSEEKVNEAKTNDIALAESSRPYYIAKAELDRLKHFREVLFLRTFQENVEGTDAQNNNGGDY